MSTASTGPLVITPIYWSPVGHTIGAGYQNVIDGYVNNVVTNQRYIHERLLDTDGVLRHQRSDPI